jgi:hypothetical protein
MDVTPLRLAALPLLALALCAVPPASAAAGGRAAFAGGTAAERAQVKAALGASSFDWSRLPPVTVHIGNVGASYSTPGDVYLDAGLLDSGRFAWGVVQHEFAHQVDFFLLDDSDRARLLPQLGAADWWNGQDHATLGCERFASNFAWAFWPVAANAMRPRSLSDEAGSIPPAAFRAEVLNTLLVT